jgi:LmbE family N-acetylglucosaminyl deacetylase
MKPFVLFLFASCLQTLLFAQAPKKLNSAEIHEAIQRLNVLGSVLYVAAHPDDENTRMISYFANERRMRTTYLSLTRGDGGQNLIGSELRELLGAMRTQELLMARSVDGGKQLFSRANDFGFSKTPEETMKIWDKDAVLADAVWAMRQVQPDIVINRFPKDPKIDNHGHHTASAILSEEAFGIANQADKYPEQLKYVSTWQPRRIFMNTTWWFYGGQEAFAKADKSKLFQLDLGVYFPYKGKSNSEISAESRSMHKCQGFGVTGTRGTSIEYLDLLQGDRPLKDPFEGINTTWTRVKGGEPIGKLVAQVEKSYNYGNPSASIAALMKVKTMIDALPDGYWKRIKSEEIKDIIRQCAGLYIEAVADDVSATYGQPTKVAIEVVNRSNAAISLEKVSILPMQTDTSINKILKNNEPIAFKKSIVIANNLPVTAPYWLGNQASVGMYNVPEQTLRGVPETPRAISVAFSMKIDGMPLEMTVPLVYKKNDNVKGEIYRPFEVLPPAFVKFSEKAYLVDAKTQSLPVKITVKAGKANLTGKVKLQTSAMWITSPESINFDLKQKGEEKTVEFTVSANPKGPLLRMAQGTYLNNMEAVAEIDGKTYNKELTIINYDHIPVQSVLLDAKAQLVSGDIQVKAKRIGYIMGAGDEVPNNLRQMGLEVKILGDADYTPENLRTFDAIVTGIRAYNTQEKLKVNHAKLMNYVENGGTYIVQYNTANGITDLVLPEIAPYKLKLSRERVTDEKAEMRFLKPDHAVLNTPNKITATDFENWVQERGLYYPTEWDTNFEAILSANDPNEKPRDGGLLVAKHGKGHYIYTGIAFFRQFPAGVPGAYRLFANLLSVGK